MQLYYTIMYSFLKITCTSKIFYMIMFTINKIKIRIFDINNKKKKKSRYSVQ